MESSESVRPGFAGDLTFELERDNNVLRVDRDPAADTIVHLRPQGFWYGLFDKHRLRLVYQGDWGRYANLDSENYQDHYVSVAGLADFSLRLKTEVSAEFRHGHDSRGNAESAFRQGQDPDRWNLAGLGAVLNYGRLDAVGRVVAKSHYKARRYLNNGQDFRDRDRAGLSAAFYYRLAPKTYLLTELAGERIDYIRSAPRNLDSSELQWLFGLRWEATAQSSGELRTGYLRKDFRDEAIDDYTGLALNLRATWRPRTYSTVEVIADRSPQETSLDGTDYYVRNLLQVSWRHAYSPVWGTDLRLVVERDDYEGEREDDLRDISAALWWRPVRNLEAGVRWRDARRDSNIDGVDFRSRSVVIYGKTEFD